MTFCGALRDLVPFVQFKKREKHPWRSVNFLQSDKRACQEVRNVSFLEHFAYVLNE